MVRTHVVTLFLVAVAACNRGGAVCGPEAATALQEAARAPSWSELASATYSGITSEPVTLRAGRWEGEPYVDGGASRPTVGLTDHFILTGDLDGNGQGEAVALLWESSGGSGNRLYLAVMARRDGNIVNLATNLIGDRVRIRSGVIDDGRIILDLVRGGPEDAGCCPTQKALVTWVLNDDGLSKVADETTGTLSLADLEGRTWVLIELGREQPLPDDVEISMVFRDDRVAGSSGCNDYFAGVSAPIPGELRFNGMGATRKACPEPLMDLERRYLSALSGAVRYTFLAGRLALSCETDDGQIALIYEPRIVH